MTATCTDCNKEFEREKRRGRPAVKCPECRTTPTRKAAPLPALDEFPIVWVAFYRRPTTSDDVVIGVFATEFEAKAAALRVTVQYTWPSFVQDFPMGLSFIGTE